jgi:hypothetical protein
LSFERGSREVSLYFAEEHKGLVKVEEEVHKRASVLSAEKEHKEASQSFPGERKVVLYLNFERHKKAFVCFVAVERKSVLLLLWQVRIEVLQLKERSDCGCDDNLILHLKIQLVCHVVAAAVVVVAKNTLGRNFDLQSKMSVQS